VAAAQAILRDLLSLKREQLICFFMGKPDLSGLYGSAVGREEQGLCGSNTIFLSNYNNMYISAICLIFLYFSTAVSGHVFIFKPCHFR